jgi:hypothetical protein
MAGRQWPSCAGRLPARRPRSRSRQVASAQTELACHLGIRTTLAPRGNHGGIVITILAWVATVIENMATVTRPVPDEKVSGARS